MVGIIDPCALLKHLANEPSESTWLEFKADLFDPVQVGKNISALSNGAMLAQKDYAFLVWGVENATHEPVGTSVKLNRRKKEGEPFTNWLTRKLDPKLNLQFLDSECDGKSFAIIVVEQSYHKTSVVRRH